MNFTLIRRFFSFALFFALVFSLFSNQRVWTMELDSVLETDSSSESKGIPSESAGQNTGETETKAEVEVEPEQQALDKDAKIELDGFKSNHISDTKSVASIPKFDSQGTELGNVNGDDHLIATRTDITTPEGMWTLGFSDPINYIGNDRTIASFYVDFVGNVNFKYNGSKTGDYLLTIYNMEYELLLDENGIPYANEKPITNDTVFDFSTVDSSEFIARYEKHVPLHHYLPDTYQIFFNNEKITADIELDNFINPTQIMNTSNYADANMNWQIKNKNGETVLSGNSKTIMEEQLNSLQNGEYDIFTTAQSQTKYRSELKAMVQKSFVIKKVEPITPPKPIISKPSVASPSTNEEQVLRAVATGDSSMNIGMLLMLLGISGFVWSQMMRRQYSLHK